MSRISNEKMIDIFFSEIKPFKTNVFLGAKCAGDHDTFNLSNTKCPKSFEEFLHLSLSLSLSLSHFVLNLQGCESCAFIKVVNNMIDSRIERESAWTRKSSTTNNVEPKL